MKIQKELQTQGPLMKNELSFENHRTTIERLNRVLQLIVSLEKKMKLTNNMSGVSEFIKESRNFISYGKPIQKEYQIKERPGVFIFGILNSDKNVKCRMIVKMEQGKKDPVYMDMSDYDEFVHNNCKTKLA